MHESLMEPMVYVIDDDHAMVESLSWFIQSLGLNVRCYTTAEEFLSKHNPDQHGCLLLDVRMPTISGPELQLKLQSTGSILPVIYISAHGDVSLVVRVMKGGAVDFLTKPFNDQLLLESINNALRIDKINRAKQHKDAMVETKFSHLSPREIQVLKGIVDGKQNKTISAQLKISLKTVEAHRASLIKKMGVKSISELVQLAISRKNHVLLSATEE